MQTNDDAPWGPYTYQTTFQFDSSTLSLPSIYGQYAADNYVIDMRLNGHIVFVNSSGNDEEFTTPITFSISNPSWFVNGLNVFQVSVENVGGTYGNPTSFVLNATVDAMSAVPEPSTFLLLGAGLAGVGIVVLLKRRQKTN